MKKISVLYNLLVIYCFLREKNKDDLYLLNAFPYLPTHFNPALKLFLD